MKKDHKFKSEDSLRNLDLKTKNQKSRTGNVVRDGPKCLPQERRRHQRGLCRFTGNYFFLCVFNVLSVYHTHAGAWGHQKKESDHLGLWATMLVQQIQLRSSGCKTHSLPPWQGSNHSWHPTGCSSAGRGSDQNIQAHMEQLTAKDAEQSSPGAQPSKPSNPRNIWKALPTSCLNSSRVRRGKIKTAIADSKVNYYQWEQYLAPEKKTWSQKYFCKIRRKISFNPRRYGGKGTEVGKVNSQK